jgi:uracil-DNA glycosylase
VRGKIAKIAGKVECAVVSKGYPQHRQFLKLVAAVRRCTLCADKLPLKPNPVFRIQPTARLLIVGQAPGIRVHRTGIPFNDPSGDRLRLWMGIDRETFYDDSHLAILPMAFCYPGTGKRGDLPPPPECAATWRRKLLAHLPNLELTLMVGQYAQRWHLGPAVKTTLAETVRAWREYSPDRLPLPHPSPRNNGWLKNNPWFERDVVPFLRDRVRRVLA